MPRLRWLWLCGCVFFSGEELYPGRLYGTLDSGFNSVDSGDKRWSGNEVGYTFTHVVFFLTFRKSHVVQGWGWVQILGWSFFPQFVPCSRVTNTFGKCAKTMFQEPLQQFFLFLTYFSFLILFNVNKASDLDDLISKSLVRERHWFLVVLNLWQNGLADLYHFWLELLFFSRTLFTLPVNCMLMLVVLALWKDDYGISSQVHMGLMHIWFWTCLLFWKNILFWEAHIRHVQLPSC